MESVFLKIKTTNEIPRNTLQIFMYRPIGPPKKILLHWAPSISGPALHTCWQSLDSHYHQTHLQPGRLYSVTQKTGSNTEKHSNGCEK
jgi:hypothetical protein